MEIVITQLPRWSYFMYFLLGFYELQKNKELKVKFRCKNIFLNINSKVSNKVMSKAVRKIYYKTEGELDRLYSMKGYIVLDNGIKRKFVIDSADAPFLFDSEDLKECDIYFKMQCPKDLDTKGFELAPDVIIPWSDHKKDENGKARKLCENFEENKYKIRPLMVGTRRLADGISYSLLKKGWDNYINSRKVKKDKNLMCYFGDSKGPIPVKVDKKDLDVDEECELLGYYGDKIQHPNEKRAKVADMIENLEPKDLYDARIIHRGNSDTERIGKREDLVVPLEDFCNYVAQFKYNMNVSGYRKSIPNRFIDSFISGTAIVTDKLYLKWYKPFGKEVFETVQMAYLKDEDVDWRKFKEDIENLPEVDKNEVLEAFEEKWSPISVCKYMIEELSKI